MDNDGSGLVVFSEMRVRFTSMMIPPSGIHNSCANPFP